MNGMTQLEQGLEPHLGPPNRDLFACPEPGPNSSHRRNARCHSSLCGMHGTAWRCTPSQALRMVVTV